MEHAMATLSSLPSTLTELADKYWQQLVSLNPDVEQLDDAQRSATLQAFAMSDFIAKSCIAEPQLLLDLWQQQELSSPFDAKALASELQQRLATQINDVAAQKVLRQCRRKQMVRIAWKELCLGQAAEQSIVQLSELADLLVQQANHWLYQQCSKEWGTPVNAAGEAQPLVVIGMGKLGGHELNFSSDIDLIFCFPENGETEGARRSIANQQFFIRMGQRLIQLLDQRTRDGFVFRVDMRLRPFGDSGPLAISFSAFEDYYQHHGRDWERYAMVKARVLNGQHELDDELKQMLRPYVYRRYIDFSAVQSLRSMKAMINSEIRRKGLKDNIKLGSGGIREIEFVVQAFQLIRGGREPSLQTRSLLQALEQLAQLGVFTDEEAQMLRRNYLYLRRVENALQQFDDQQTQTLPTDEINQQRLVVAMQQNDWDSFYEQLQTVHQEVNDFFQQAIGEEEQQAGKAEPVYEDLWHCGAKREELTQVMASLVDEQERINPRVEALYHFMHALERRQIGQRGRQTLERLMPCLLQQLLTHEQVDLVLPRVMQLLERIVQRTAYLELLAENPGALQQLLRLCAGSAMLADMLANYPILLDELLDPKLLFSPVEPESYRSQLREFMLRIPPEDMEQQMEALRQFKQIQTLRITAADIAGALPLMKVSDHLTAVAEVIVEAVVEQAWLQITERFGKPSHLEQGERGFAVIGYGKIGGIETGYGSDLDLVFLHNSESSHYTDGEKSIDAKQFYLKLAQRIMFLFNTRTASGVLYELDMRLRPSGSSGLLVSSLEAYADYQRQQAWTWEHQALVRARPIYGDSDLCEGFGKVREEILSRPRQSAELQAQVIEMRDKMKGHLSRESEHIFDLKQSAGGMVDIEFLAQYLVLANAAESKELMRWSDNVRIFEVAGELGLLTAEQTLGLIQAYLDIRDEGHRQSLQGQPRLVERQRFDLDLSVVCQAWQQFLPRANADSAP